MHCILANAFHTPVKGTFEYLEQCLININEAGIIIGIYQKNDEQYQTLLTESRRKGLLEVLPEGAYLLPGMVDLHIHAPQWPQAGKGLDLPLDEWLMNYTFPLESKYTDLDFAARIYPHLIDTYLAHGTTTAVYFATIDNQSSQYLAEVCIAKGQRAFVGCIAMDNKLMCPDYYVDSSYEESINKTESFVLAIKNLPNNKGLVEAVVTPRFIPSCTLDSLKGLGDIAQKYNCVVQTHASESDWARNYSLENYNKTDVQLYNEAGLLGRKTILAHSIFLTENDINIINDKQTGIAHCPLSNIFFANAALPTRELLDKEINLGLGSDVAASPYPSLFRACFDAVSHSRAREDGTDNNIEKLTRGIKNARITLLEAYWMATVGGAQVLDIPVGQFKVGFHFDAICVSTSENDAHIPVYKDLDSTKDIFEKIIAYTSSSSILKTWVSGRPVNAQATTN